MIKKNSIRADFLRNPGVACIDVYLPGEKEPLSLFDGIVDYCSKVLGEKEIAEVINILSRKKEALLKQHNFPQKYDELLSELIEAQTARYAAKREKEEEGGKVVPTADALDVLLGIKGKVT